MVQVLGPGLCCQPPATEQRNSQAVRKAQELPDAPDFKPAICYKETSSEAHPGARL